MNKYDVLYILVNDMDEAAKVAMNDKFKDLIVSLGGNVIDVDVWGTRRFAYEIDDRYEGYYVKIVFEADSSVPAELNRIMGITDGVVRNMVRRLA